MIAFRLTPKPNRLGFESSTLLARLSVAIADPEISLCFPRNSGSASARKFVRHQAAALRWIGGRHIAMLRK
jgi:hypothetical protein